MTGALLLAVGVAQAIVPAPVASPSPAAIPMPPPVTDWGALPLYPMPRAATILDAASYVRAEVEAGRCPPVAPPASDGARVVAPVAILVGVGGAIRRIVPRAIDCPTVEQYTVGYLLSATRTVPVSTLPPAPGWYRLTVTYRW